MKLLDTAAPILGLAVSAVNAWPAGTGTVGHPETTVYTTIVVPTYTTYCPSPTTFAYHNTTYTVTQPTTITITNCPCTLSIHTPPPVTTTSTCYPPPPPPPFNNHTSIIYPNTTTTPSTTTITYTPPPETHLSGTTAITTPPPPPPTGGGAPTRTPVGPTSTVRPPPVVTAGAGRVVGGVGAGVVAVVALVAAL